MNKECGIYKIVCNINNKSYVGQSVNIKERWTGHKRALNKNTHKNKYLQRAWNKYGDGCFTFEIIENCKQEYLSEREIFWIKELDSFKSGYNATKGGEVVNKRTIVCLSTGEVFNSVSEIEEKYNIPNSNIIKCCKFKRQSCGKLEDGTPLIWNYYENGKKYKKLTKKEVFEYIKRNKKIYSNSRRVRCITTNEVFDTISDAEDKYQIFGVRQCCEGKYINSGSKDGIPLVWQWNEEFEDGVIKKKIDPFIICLNDLKEFYSLEDAKEFYGLNNTSLISQCIRGVHGIKRIRLKDEGVITFLYYKEYKDKTEDEILSILNSL